MVREEEAAGLAGAAGVAVEDVAAAAAKAVSAGANAAPYTLKMPTSDAYATPKRKPT